MPQSVVYYYFRSLATTDLCVGFISEPLAVTFWMSVVNTGIFGIYWNICYYLFRARFQTDYIFIAVSLLTLAAISVDRLLALLLGLRYRQVVTLKRTYVFVITSWLVSTVFSATHFLNFQISFWYASIVITLCLVTSIFCYTKNFLNLRHLQNQVQ